MLYAMGFCYAVICLSDVELWFQVVALRVSQSSRRLNDHVGMQIESPFARVIDGS